MSKRTLAFSSRKRQQGAEMIEAPVTLLLVFLIFFLILDMSVVIFNKGTADLAVREGARQGSLYWVDPSDYSETDPRGNLRMKEEMIHTAVEFFYDNMLINTSDSPLTQWDDSCTPSTKSCLGIDLTGYGVVSDSSFSRLWEDVADATVTLNLVYPHDYLVISRLLSLADVTLGASSTSPTEPDL